MQVSYLPIVNDNQLWNMTLNSFIGDLHVFCKLLMKNGPQAECKKKVPLAENHIEGPRSLTSEWTYPYPVNLQYYSKMYISCNPRVSLDIQHRHLKYIHMNNQEYQWNVKRWVCKIYKSKTRPLILESEEPI